MLLSPNIIKTQYCTTTDDLNLSLIANSEKIIAPEVKINK